MPNKAQFLSNPSAAESVESTTFPPLSIPKKRGRRPNSEKNLETADKKFTLLLEPSEQQAIEVAFLEYIKKAQNDPVLTEHVSKKYGGNWDPVLHRNQMLKHAIRLYFRSLGVDLDAKPPRPETPTVP